MNVTIARVFDRTRPTHQGPRSRTSREIAPGEDPFTVDFLAGGQDFRTVRGQWGEGSVEGHS